MALKFAEVPGGGSFAPGAGPSWFEMANRQIASLWTGEVSLVLTGVLVALAAFVLLAACGVDGEPERPEARTPVNLSVTGTAEVGLSGGSS